MRIGKDLAFNFKMLDYALKINHNSQINGVSNSIIDLVKTPYDKLDISDKGRNMYMNSIRKNDVKTDNRVDKDMQELEKRDFKKDFVDKTVKYRDDIEKIKKSDLSEEEKNKAIKSLNKKYTKEVDSSINEITDEFDDYFDMGRESLDKFSKDDVDDLFDEDKFKANFKSKIAKLRDTIVNSPNLKSIDKIYEVFSNKESSTSELEDMSFQDMKELNRYMYEKKDSKDLGELKAIAFGSIIAMKENSSNEFIDTLGFSDEVKKALFTLNERNSEVSMRKVAHEEEVAKMQEKIDELKDQMKKAIFKVAKISGKLEAIEEEFGVSPDNKILFRPLKREHDAMIEYYSIKSESDEEKDRLLDLNTNKYKIKRYDSYKRMKATYSEEKEIREEDDDEKLEKAAIEKVN